MGCAGLKRSDCPTIKQIFNRLTPGTSDAEKITELLENYKVFPNERTMQYTKNDNDQLKCKKEVNSIYT